jgi:ABC-type polysaccharide/polyol phosphate transport system ATPase subunit
MIDLTFNHVSKKYRIRQEAEESEAPQSAIKRKLRSLRRRSQEFIAVNDVSFEVTRGQALGIIGHNGAGKSTVLKMLSNITTPTSGEITINGRLSALIEVGSGFHPELTGRENIYLAGAILGMRRREIAIKLDSIVEFAGLKQFLDVPVKRYSSGMYVRLGFSIAAHLEPDILLLDEVLAVGDAAFQSKCIERISELKRQGTTIVFISHDLVAVEKLCDRVLLMQRGQVINDGVPHEIITQYRQMTTEFVSSTPLNSGMTKEAEVTSMTFHDAAGQASSTFSTGRPLTARVEYAALERIEDAVFEVFFYSPDGHMHCQLTTEYGDEKINLEPGTGVVEFFCPGLGLLPDVYYVDVVIKRRGAAAGSGIDWQARCVTIRVDPSKVVRGSFYNHHEWRFIKTGGNEFDASVERKTKEFASRI